MRPFISILISFFLAFNSTLAAYAFDPGDFTYREGIKTRIKLFLDSGVNADEIVRQYTVNNNMPEDFIRDVIKEIQIDVRKDPHDIENPKEGEEGEDVGDNKDKKQECSPPPRDFSFLDGTTLIFTPMPAPSAGNEFISIPLKEPSPDGGLIPLDIKPAAVWFSEQVDNYKGNPAYDPRWFGYGKTREMYIRWGDIKQPLPSHTRQEQEGGKGIENDDYNGMVSPPPSTLNNILTLFNSENGNPVKINLNNLSPQNAPVTQKNLERNKFSLLVNKAGYVLASLAAIILTRGALLKGSCPQPAFHGTGLFYINYGNGSESACIDRESDGTQIYCENSDGSGSSLLLLNERGCYDIFSDGYEGKSEVCLL